MVIEHANASEYRDPEQSYNAHEIRITSHGKISAWVDFALKFFQVRYFVVEIDESIKYRRRNTRIDL